jgi:hypothetical protein
MIMGPRGRLADLANKLRVAAAGDIEAVEEATSQRLTLSTSIVLPWGGTLLASSSDYPPRPSTQGPQDAASRRSAARFRRRQMLQHADGPVPIAREFRRP